MRRSNWKTGSLGWMTLVVIVGACVVTLPWSLDRYDVQDYEQVFQSPGQLYWLGSDELGRSLGWRCLLGGAISMGIGLAAAGISVGLGVVWGATAGYLGGRVDAVMMRIVDILYGLPYILLVVLLNLALTPAFTRLIGMVFSEDTARHVAGLVTLLVAIGGVSWLTLARVIRGQVLSLREQPFLEAARACGIGPVRTFWFHLLPNLVGPTIVYGTLSVPGAVLAESFLSFLGIGVQPPLPSWGNLAAQGTAQLANLGLPGTVVRWWLLLWPCVLLGATLMALNFFGDRLRDKLDPKTR